ncbi:hypothetical protein ABET51_10455 [Metabacillus fastidiosus]|uniref:YncE family protein n=1 Tax=Metabacillus fastidiosus TaxID=1458 RepID=UPI003D2691F1
MTWLNKDIAKKWRLEGERYASDVNAFVHKGLSLGWDQVDERDLMEDRRTELADPVFNMIIEANKAGDLALLREELPPATWPLAANFQNRMQAVKSVFFINDKAIVFRGGSTWEDGYVYVATSKGTKHFEQYTLVGRSPNREMYAFVDEKGISTMKKVDENLNGEQIHHFSWEFIEKRIKKLNIPISLTDEFPHHQLTEVIPFSSGRKVILISSSGTFLVTAEQLTVLDPDPKAIEEWVKEDDLGDLEITMEHAALSYDEKWIVCGSQSSSHLIYDHAGKFISELYPDSSYPHFSWFTSDSKKVICNSCHFYNGISFAAPLTNLKSEEEFPLIDDNSRVYAATAREGEVYFGDAYGYVRAASDDGSFLWQYFVGGTIAGMDISSDGKWLAVGTYSGMLHLIELNIEERDLYTISTANHKEKARWIVWKNTNDIYRW